MSQAPNSITIRLLEAAEQRRDDPRARVYINDHVSPGASFSRRMEVVNTTGVPQTLDFYAAAATVSESSFGIGEGRAQNELTQWMTVEPRSATLPNGGRIELTATVRIPSDAAPGERYAAVLADRPAPPASGGLISTGARVGIRVYLSVGPGGEPASDFVVDSLTAKRDDTGRPVVAAEVRNTGGRALDLSGDLELSEGPGGLAAGPFPLTLGTTLGIGQSRPVDIALDQALPSGPWRAVLVVRSGLLERGVEGVITFPTGPGRSAAPVKAEPLHLAQDPDVLIPIAGSLILLVLLLLLFLLWKRRREEDDEVDSQIPAAVPV